MITKRFDQKIIQHYRMTSVPLMQELCRLFHARERAILCAASHGQLTIDGYIIRPEHFERWTAQQLIGRYATLVGRTHQLYGSTPVGR